MKIDEKEARELETQIKRLAETKLVVKKIQMLGLNFDVEVHGKGETKSL